MNIIKHGYVTPKSRSNFRHNGWPTVITLKDGTLLAGWSGDRLKHICPFGRVKMARSNDGGYTWLPAYTAQDTTLDDRDTGLLQVDDKIFMSSFSEGADIHRKYLNHWLHAPDTDAKKRLIAAYADMLTDEDNELVGPTLAVSRDNGYTFTYPGKIPVSSPHGPLLTKDGKVLFIGTLQDKSSKFFISKGIYAAEFDENCNVVGDPRPVALVPDFIGERCEWCEPHAAVMPNGDILVGIRMMNKVENIQTIYLCRSKDGGKTFSEPEPTGIEGLPPHLFVDSKGRVILSYGRRADPMGIRAKISYDNGYTFGEEIILRDDGVDWDLGYPSTTENAEGQLVTVYYMKDTPDAYENRICYTIWTV